MPGSSSWMPYAPQGVKRFDDDDDDDDDCCDCDDYCHLGYDVVWSGRHVPTFRASMEAAGSSDMSLELHICSASRPRRQ